MGAPRPEDEDRWGDLPPSALEHPLVRLVQVIVLFAAIWVGVDRFGLLEREIRVDSTTITSPDPLSAAASVARDAYGNGTDTVIIAGTEGLADSLAATTLAGVLGAPILLNEPDRMSAEVVTVIRDLAPSRAVILGGSQALGGIVPNTLEETFNLEVVRIAGPSRFDTAALIADAVVAEREPGRIGGRRTAIVAVGERIADALAAGALASARNEPLPVLLGQRDAIPDVTLAALERHGIEHVLLIGDTATISGAAERDLTSRGITVERFPETGAALSVALAVYAEEAKGYAAPRVVLVPPDDDVRALVAGPLAGAESGVLLIDGAPETTAWLADACGSVRQVILVGPEATPQPTASPTARDPAGPLGAATDAGPDPLATAVPADPLADELELLTACADEE